MPIYPRETELNLAKIAKMIHTFWIQEAIFERSIQQHENQQPFVFFEGPPSANGAPGIHHMLAMTIKDLFTRYKAMQGYYVPRKSGWDTHGLPVELQVEKKLAITKEDIGTKISIADYNAQCKQTVMTYKSQWEAINQAIGYWKDNQDPYITYQTPYIESVWYLLKALYNNGLIYKGHAIQPYSPAAGTGLSSHELNQPGCYQWIEETSIIAQFKQVDHPNLYFLAWTTTPWTLPANSALAIHPEVIYVQVATKNPYTQLPIEVILAEETLPHFFGVASNHPWEVKAHHLGSQLIGRRYEQLMAYIQPTGDGFRLIPADFVTTKEGTGIVHIAPHFGADDYRIAQKENITPIGIPLENGQIAPIVDRAGRFVEEITDFAGRYVKAGYQDDPNIEAVDLSIAKQLKASNRAFKVYKHGHNYPHCWRTQKPILYYPLDSWFIKTTSYKEMIIETNQAIQWKPTSIGTGRFANWLEGVVDWNISRDRYWGTPLPIWRTADQKEEKCIGSLEELHFEVEQARIAGYMTHPLPQELDLHRPYVDEIILVSPSGKPMYREKVVLDVWFDSGAMPYAQWHYPFENQKKFEQNFPADFIAEGVDQTRGWFFTLHAISTLLFEMPAFKNVVVNGLVLDKNGNKMSKSLGNTLDPVELLAQHGPDAIRWYMVSNANPWDNLKFDPMAILEVTRKFFITLHSTYNFFALYATLDGFDGQPISSQLGLNDAWITSRLQTLIQEVSGAYEAYEATLAARAIQDFVVNDLSNWYIRLNRKRFWKNSQDEDKAAAYQTLYEALTVIAKLMAPIAPFYADHLYKSLNDVTQKEQASSVHLTQFPEAKEEQMNTALEQQMGDGQTISSLAHRLRKKHQVKVRQPLASLYISMGEQTRLPEDIVQIIEAEVNVKTIKYFTENDHFIQKKAKANFPSLGKKYKAKMNRLSQAIMALTQEEINQIESGTTHLCRIDGQEIPLTLNDISIITEDIPGWCIAKQGNMAIALDLTLTVELEQEGIARDTIHAIQQLRKKIGLEVQDQIILMVKTTNQVTQQAIFKHQSNICQETLAQEIHFSLSPCKDAHMVQIGEERVNIYLEKV